MKTNMKRYFLWPLINIPFAYLVYLGYWDDVSGARNVVIFVSWVLLLLSLVGAMSRDIQKENAKAHAPPSWYRQMDNLYDLSITALLIWTGAWIVGTVYFLHWCFKCVFNANVREIRNTSEQRQAA